MCAWCGLGVCEFAMFMFGARPWLCEMCGLPPFMPTGMPFCMGRFRFETEGELNCPCAFGMPMPCMLGVRLPIGTPLGGRLSWGLPCWFGSMPGGPSLWYWVASASIAFSGFSLLSCAYVMTSDMRLNVSPSCQRCQRYVENMKRNRSKSTSRKLCTDDGPPQLPLCALGK